MHLVLEGGGQKAEPPNMPRRQKYIARLKRLIDKVKASPSSSTGRSAGASSQTSWTHAGGNSTTFAATDDSPQTYSPQSTSAYPPPQPPPDFSAYEASSLDGSPPAMAADGLSSASLAALSREQLIRRMLIAFNKGDGSFSLDDLEAWLAVKSSSWAQREKARAKQQESPEGDSHFLAALEKSRRVVEEERMKFNRLLARDQPQKKAASKSRIMTDTGQQAARPFSQGGAQPRESCRQQSREQLDRLLKIHRHGGAAENKRRRQAGLEVGGGGSSPIRSYSCPVLEVILESESKNRDEGEKVVVRPRMSLMLNLPPRGSELDFRLFGYEYVDFLAEGGLGTLYLVRELGVEEKLWVAKVVDFSSFARAEEASQALLEAELLRRMRHPNIVEYRNSYVTDNQLVLIMEYCQVGDLHGHILSFKRRKERISEALILKWIWDIASGLHYMHLHNVLHCDIKSSNIFLDNENNAKIGDLGIARELRNGANALSPLRCPRGTPVYMSPEMCRRAALTERSDCWSLGCILFELCHLEHAFSSQLNLGHRKKRHNTASNHTVSVRNEAASSCKRSNGTPSVSSKSSHSSSLTAPFLPGLTGRSDMSYMGREMLKNIKTDLKKIKKNATSSLEQEVFSIACDTASTSYWRCDASSTFFLPQVLPPQYSPLLNYLVCAMLEPNPADRPSLRDLIQVLPNAATGNYLTLDTAQTIRDDNP